jgi:membrane associated rhomboid family serine protease/Flp pilus assembly protein TadD
MPACPCCGKEFSGFSFGRTPADECPDCRKSNPQAAAIRRRRPDAPSDDFVLPYGGPPVVTGAIIAINVLVFLAMGISGVSWTEPGYQALVRSGANFGPLTLSGEWWRLLSSTFVHIGILHVALNMWCLWDLGSVLERLMGWKSFVITYSVTGIAGSELSLAWRPMGGGAGASGAIFGVAGAFFSFLYFRKVPIGADFAKRRLKSLVVFIFYNLCFGAVALRVNNAAHVGGLLAGLILGAVLPRALPPKQELAAQSARIPSPVPDVDWAARQAQYRRLGLVAMVSVLVLVSGAAAVRKHDAAIAQYGSAVRLIRAAQPSAAIQHLRNAIALNPKDPDARQTLGILLLDEGNPVTALPMLESAVELNPNSLQLRHNLALGFLGTGYCENAVREIDWALKSPAENAPAADFVEGLGFYCQGRLQQASTHLLSAIQNRQDFFEAQVALARVYIDMHKLDDARSLYSAVLSRHSGDPVAKGGLAFLDSPPKPRLSADQLPSIFIPYSKLTSKSDYWPLFP